MLAYENFNRSSSIDILLGADVFFEVLRHDKKTRPGNYPFLKDTDLGWIVSGKTPLAAPEEVPRKVSSSAIITTLDQQLQRFWENEELTNKTWTAEEILYEEHFKKRTARVDTGSYIVRLPRREGQGRLGESYEQVHQLERQFQEHPDLHQACSEFMQEYEELGHMNQINEDVSSPTRTRIVFDGSCRSSNGLCLNDTLLLVPAVQRDFNPSFYDLKTTKLHSPQI